jgi:hypothetical protein
MSLIADLTDLATALKNSSAFRTWVGAADVAAAGAFIFPVSADRELASKTEGYCCAVISHGEGFKRRRETLGDDFYVSPEFVVEFVQLVDKDDDDSDVFNELLSDVSGIVVSLDASSHFKVNEVGFKSSDEPRRARPGSAVDWASLQIVVRGDEWDG